VAWIGSSSKIGIGLWNYTPLLHLLFNTALSPHAIPSIVTKALDLTFHLFTNTKVEVETQTRSSETHSPIDPSIPTIHSSYLSATPERVKSPHLVAPVPKRYHSTSSTSLIRSEGGTPNCLSDPTSFYWREYVHPVLWRYSKLCRCGSLMLRGMALAILHRSLLITQLDSLTAQDWWACFEMVILPTLEVLSVEGEAERGLYVTGSVMISRVFLRQIEVLHSLHHFANLWLLILCHFVKAGKGGVVNDTVAESFKNIVLVMLSSGYLKPPKMKKSSSQQGDSTTTNVGQDMNPQDPLTFTSHNLSCSSPPLSTLSFSALEGSGRTPLRVDEDLEKGKVACNYEEQLFRLISQESVWVHTIETINLVTPTLLQDDAFHQFLPRADSSTPPQSPQIKPFSTSTQPEVFNLTPTPQRTTPLHPATPTPTPTLAPTPTPTPITTSTPPPASTPSTAIPSPSPKIPTTIQMQDNTTRQRPRSFFSWLSDDS
jgi:hypothetical protein